MCVNVNKEIIKGAFSGPLYKDIWINHYWTRSLEEWKEKAERGQADTGRKRDFAMLDNLDSFCTKRV